MSGRGGDGFQYQSSRSNYRGGRGGHRGGGRGRGGEGGYRGGRGGHHYSQYDSAPKQPYQSQPQQQPQQQQQAPPTQQPPAQQKPQASQTPNPAAKEFKSKLPPSVQKFDIPVRTSSAPPNLQEQEKHVHKKEFFPSKASIPFVPAHQYPQPPYYQPPFQQPFHDQSAAPVKPAATTASPQPKKRGLAIVDPNTGTDILTGEKVMEVKPEEPKKAETKTEETKEPETAPAQKEETGKPAEETEDKENEEEEGDEMEDEENGDEEEEEEEDKEEESGKRIYSKEFLLRFKDKFTQPPESLLHSEIFTGRAAGDAQKYPVSPKPQRGGRGRGGKQRGSGRGGARGGRGGKQQAKKAAWAVAKNEEEAVSKDALFILNKLAPETYTKLLEQFVKLPITSPEILKQVIYTIYDKAVYEPNFGSLYADLCSDLSQKLKVGTDNATAAFKKILLNRCQEEFEQKANASAGQASTEGEKEPTPEEKEEKEMKLRKRMVGNIIFIGELFKKKMLSEKIMHEVIKTLLVNDEVPTPDNLELLAKLLTTIGQLLDHEKASKFMDFYFSKLKALSTNKAIPSRNRYLIIDVLELRENAWVPRIKKETAKTKKEVHKEAEQEKLEQERIMREKAQKLGITSSRGGRGGGRGRGYDNRESRENKEKKGGQGGQEWTKAKRYTSGSIKAPSESRLGPPEKSAGAGSAGWGVAQSNAFAALMEDENAADESNQDSEAAPENVEESGKMEGEPLSEEELAKKLKSIIGNFTESGDEDDAMKDIKELVATEKYIIAKYLLKAAVEESNEQNFKDAQTLIVRTVDDKYFKSADFTKAAHECYKQMIENEVQVEAPVQLRQFAEVCGRLVGAGCLHLDDVDNVVASQPSVGGASLAEMLPYAYHGVRRHYEIIEADFKAIIKEFSATKLNVLKYINPSRSLEVDKFVNNMKKFKIEEMEPVSGILTYLQSQKDVDDVIAFVEDKLPDSHATTEKIMGAVITAIEITTMFARGKSNPEEEEKAMFEQYGKLLDSLTGSVDNQVILLNELQRFCSRTAFAKEVMGRLFKLFKDRWAYEEAIETWKKDDSIEGHAKALESIAE